MDYEATAEELLRIHGALSRMEINRQMDGFIRGELFALSCLYDRDRSAYPKDLSRDLCVSSARIAVLLNHLEGKGWIARANDPVDSRQTVVRLTDAGLAVLETEKQSIIAALVDVLRDLGEEDATHLLRIRKKMLHQ